MQQLLRGDNMRREFLLIFYLIIRTILGEDTDYNEDAITPDSTQDDVYNVDQLEGIDDSVIPDVYVTSSDSNSKAETETPETVMPLFEENEHQEPAPQPNTPYKHQEAQPPQPEPNTNKKRNNEFYSSFNSESANFQSSASSVCKICKKSDGCGHIEHVQSSVANHEQASVASSFTEVKKSPDGYEERAGTSSLAQEQSSSVTNEYYKRGDPFDAENNGRGINPKKSKHNAQNTDEPVTDTKPKENPDDSNQEYPRDVVKEPPKTDITRVGPHSETKDENYAHKRDEKNPRHKKQENEEDNQNRESIKDKSDNGYKDNHQKPAIVSNYGTKSETTPTRTSGCKYCNANHDNTDNTDVNINNGKRRKTDTNVRTNENRNNDQPRRHVDTQKGQTGKNVNKNPSKEHDHSSANTRKESQTRRNGHTRENKGGHLLHNNSDHKKKKDIRNVPDTQSNSNADDRRSKPSDYQERLKDETDDTNTDKAKHEKVKTDNQTFMDDDKQPEEESKVSSDQTVTAENDSETNKRKKIDTNASPEIVHNIDPNDQTKRNENNTDTNKTASEDKRNHNPIIEVKQKTNENNENILDLLIIFPDDDCNDHKDENPTQNDDNKHIKEKLDEPPLQNTADQTKPTAQSKPKKCNCRRKNNRKNKKNKPTESDKTDGIAEPEQHNESHSDCDKDHKGNDNNVPQQETNEDTTTNKKIINSDQLTNEEIQNIYNTEHNIYNTKYNTYNTESATRTDNIYSETNNEYNVRDNKNINTEQNPDVKTDNNIQSTGTDSVRITNDNSTTNNDKNHSVPDKNKNKKQPKLKVRKERAPNKIYRFKPDKSHKRKGRHDATHLQGKQKIHHAIQNNINIKTFIMDDEDGPGQCFCCCKMDNEDVFFKYD